MFKCVKPQTKLLVIGVSLSVVMLVGISRMVFQPSNEIIHIAGEESSYLEEFYEAKNSIAGIGSSATGRASNTVLVCVLAAALPGAALIWLFAASGEARGFNRVVAQLTESSGQVASAPSGVSAASRSLPADSSLEQADCLAETSLPLEEIASMTGQNADNARLANTLAPLVAGGGETCEAANSGSENMAEMNGAINKIEESFDEMTKTIRVIDEIAFQRNLFALNVIDEIASQANLLASDAAVKAARVGEAAKAFAVVAEEVRNLAIRSAEAAKDTAAIMEESAKNGVDVTAEVTKVLEEIMQSFGKTTGLVAGIAATLQERSGDIKQTNMSLPRLMRERRLSS